MGSTGSAAAAAPGRRSGPIDGFFKDAGDEDHRNPCDFNTFLRSSGARAQPAAKPQQQAKAEAEPKPEPGMKPVVVLYGTEFGFSKEIAQKLCSQLRSTGLFWCAQQPELRPLHKRAPSLEPCIHTRLARHTSRQSPHAFPPALSSPAPVRAAHHAFSCTQAGTYHHVLPRRPQLEDMAEHPEGYDLAGAQVAIMACSTQVGKALRPPRRIRSSRRSPAE